MDLGSLAANYLGGAIGNLLVPKQADAQVLGASNANPAPASVWNSIYPPNAAQNVPQGAPQPSGTGPGGSITSWDRLSTSAPSTNNNQSPYAPGQAPAQTGNSSLLDQYRKATNNPNAQQNEIPAGFGGINPPADQQLIDQNYGEISNYLNSLQGSAQSGYNSIVSGINSGYNTANTNLGASQDAANKQIAQQQTEGDQRKQDALTAATRLYNELIMGGQQRFGGASSAGEAYAALTGRELQRNQQATQNDYSTFMGQIATAKNNLQTQYENSLRTLEQNRQDSLRQAEADYNSKLDQINSSRTQALQDKNNAKLSLLQNLRNQVYNINVANAQNSSTLKQTLAQYQQQLQAAEQQIAGNLQQTAQGQQAYNANVNLNPTTSLSMGTQGGGGQNFTPTGQIASAQGNRDQFGNLLYATG